MPAGSYLVVVSFDPSTNAAQLALFRSTFGIAGTVPVIGLYDGKLDNGGENLELLHPDIPLPLGTPDASTVPYYTVDKVEIYLRTRCRGLRQRIGTGNSLQRRTALEYGNDPINWIAAAPTPGSASGSSGGAPAITSLTPSQSVSLGANLVVAVTASGSDLRYQWLFNGSALSTATNNSLSVTNIQANNAGVYQVTVSNPNGAASGSVLLDVKRPCDCAAACLQGRGQFILHLFRSVGARFRPALVSMVQGQQSSHKPNRRIDHPQLISRRQTKAAIAWSSRTSMAP